MFKELKPLTVIAAMLVASGASASDMAADMQAVRQGLVDAYKCLVVEDRGNETRMECGTGLVRTSVGKLGMQMVATFPPKEDSGLFVNSIVQNFCRSSTQRQEGAGISISHCNQDNRTLRFSYAPGVLWISFEDKQEHSGIRIP